MEFFHSISHIGISGTFCDSVSHDEGNVVSFDTAPSTERRIDIFSYPSGQGGATTRGKHAVANSDVTHAGSKHPTVIPFPYFLVQPKNKIDRT